MIRRRTVLKLIITVQQPYEKASIESFKSLCLIVEFAQVRTGLSYIQGVSYRLR